MKTLIFCTAWSDSDEVWRFRYHRWLEHILNSDIKFNQILLIDDGSTCLPSFEGMIRINPESLPNQEPNSKLVFAHFKNNLGRKALTDYPGWWRSFGFAAIYAERYGFDKVVHIESDSFLLSQKIVRYVNALETGWNVFWCPRWRFPETSIQVIAKDHLNQFKSFTSQSYEKYVGLFAEKFLPFSNIEHSFCGDRYGEYRLDIPCNADYATQVQLSNEVSLTSRRIKKAVVAITLGLHSIPLHPVLFSSDGWTLINECTTVNVHSLMEFIAELSNEAVVPRPLDAIQLTILPTVMNFEIPITHFRKLLSNSGEVFINIRPNQDENLTGNFADFIVNNGFKNVARCSVPKGGEWLICLADSCSLEDTLVRERNNLRFRFLAAN